MKLDKLWCKECNSSITKFSYRETANCENCGSSAVYIVLQSLGDRQDINRLENNPFPNGKSILAELQKDKLKRSKKFNTLEEFLASID